VVQRQRQFLQQLNSPETGLLSAFEKVGLPPELFRTKQVTFKKTEQALLIFKTRHPELTQEDTTQVLKLVKRKLNVNEVSL
jgi:hypothetical protein